MLFVQISDMHYQRKGMLAFGKIDTHACLERCIEQIRALTPAPDAVLITGDLTNDGDLLAYQAMADLLAALKLPVYPIPGNHDDRDLIRQAFPMVRVLSPKGPLCYAVEHFPVRLLALDSSVDGKPHGRLSKAQLDWLDEKLGEASEKPVIVMLHHPPFKTGLGHMDTIMLQDADRLAAVIKAHPQVERVLCGHVHRAVQTRFAGTIAQIAPGSAHQIKLALGEEGGLWNAEPPGLLMHYWRDDMGLVTHQLPIGDFAPEGRFSDPHIDQETQNKR